ncbi:hypothetical protein IC006_0617 [Sulfuracidifex tepidarius]|uniref:Uncharacterized protein n=1 Tax=Sulfuracidifex tepidarius TaxID=1294262 RepID=A0A510DT16_9CREN|nr:hypothetical protein [Sulfuracidifex tepidarius]BBG23333.1 hypothetical protein IC006_0617 [Sulfuracidifex tepidarius]
MKVVCYLTLGNGDIYIDTVLSVNVVTTLGLDYHSCDICKC